MGSEKPTDIVAMLRHFFRVTAVKEGCDQEVEVKRGLRMGDRSLITNTMKPREQPFSAAEMFR